jgi:hypothetical protein
VPAIHFFREEERTLQALKILSGSIELDLVTILAMRLTARDAAIYTVSSRWTRISAQRASSHSACTASQSGLPAGISEISKSFREMLAPGRGRTK